MSVFYFMGSFGYGELSKKSCLAERDILPMNLTSCLRIEGFSLDLSLTTLPEYSRKAAVRASASRLLKKTRYRGGLVEAFFFRAKSMPYFRATFSKEWFFHGTLLSLAAPVWARKKQLPAAVKVMVDQGCVVAAYGCGGVIEGGEQVRADISYFCGIGL